LYRAKCINTQDFFEQRSVESGCLTKKHTPNRYLTLCYGVTIASSPKSITVPVPPFSSSDRLDPVR